MPKPPLQRSYFRLVELRTFPPVSISTTRLVVLAVEDPKDRKEQVDNVEV